jgi:heme/copper-type cytochrome/quinol oxidase subunit 1
MRHPAKWFTATAALLVFFAFVSKSRAPSLDVQIHDAYFVFSAGFVFLAMSVLLALFAGVYYVLPVNPRAAGAHFWLTAAGILLFWVGYYWYAALFTPLAGSVDFRSMDFTAAERWTRWIYFSIAVMLIAQGIFLVNLISGIVKLRTIR